MPGGGSSAAAGGLPVDRLGRSGVGISGSMLWYQSECWRCFSFRSCSTRRRSCNWCSCSSVSSSSSCRSEGALAASSARSPAEGPLLDALLDARAVAFAMAAAGNVSGNGCGAGSGCLGIAASSKGFDWKGGTGGGIGNGDTAASGTPAGGISAASPRCHRISAASPRCHGISAASPSRAETSSPSPNGSREMRLLLGDVTCVQVTCKRSSAASHMARKVELTSGGGGGGGCAGARRASLAVAMSDCADAASCRPGDPPIALGRSACNITAASLRWFTRGGATRLLGRLATRMAQPMFSEYGSKPAQVR